MLFHPFADGTFLGKSGILAQWQRYVDAACPVYLGFLNRDKEMAPHHSSVFSKAGCLLEDTLFELFPQLGSEHPQTGVGSTGYVELSALHTGPESCRKHHSPLVIQIIPINHNIPPLSTKNYHNLPLMDIMGDTREKCQLFFSTFI